MITCWLLGDMGYSHYLRTVTEELIWFPFAWRTSALFWSSKRKKGEYFFCVACVYCTTFFWWFEVWGFLESNLQKSRLGIIPDDVGTHKSWNKKPSCAFPLRPQFQRLVQRLKNACPAVNRPNTSEHEYFEDKSAFLLKLIAWSCQT